MEMCETLASCCADSATHKEADSDMDRSAAATVRQPLSRRIVNVLYAN